MISRNDGTSEATRAQTRLVSDRHSVSVTSLARRSSPCSSPPIIIVLSEAENLYQLPLPTVHNLEPGDRELFQLYTKYTSTTLSDKPRIQEAWRTEVTKEALPYAFLLHGLVSLSAAHLAHLNPERRIFYRSKAIVHRNRALQLCIPALRKITQANCLALFVFSSTIAVSTFASPDLSNVKPTSPVDDISTFFTMIKGVSTILQGRVEWIRASSLGILLHEDRFQWRLSLGPLPQELSLPMQRLRQWNEIVAIDTQIACAEAIKDLEAVFRAQPVISGDRTLLFVWCAIVTPEYVNQVKSRQPMALVVLAHYAALLHTVRSQWWSAYRGRQIVGAVYEELDASWKPAVQWPMEIVSED